MILLNCLPTLYIRLLYVTLDIFLKTQVFLKVIYFLKYLIGYEFYENGSLYSLSTDIINRFCEI